MPKGVEETFSNELAYFVQGNVVKKSLFYQNQLEKARYTTELCILNKQNKIIQRVPILKITQTNAGGVNFIIDRLAFTDKVQAKGTT